jgi:hypothetical protein
VIDPSIEAQINKLFADLRCEIDAQQEADTKRVLAMVSKAAGEVFGECGNKLINNLSNILLKHVEKLVRDTHSQLFALVDKRFAELQARLEGFLPDRDPSAPRRKVLDS